MEPLDPATTALVTIDLMRRIAGRPVEPHSGPDVVERSMELAAVFRKAGATVVHVRVERPNVDEQPPGSDLVGGLVEGDDQVVVKRSIGAFATTELDTYLREHGIRTLVFTGIATNLGVESTVRGAVDRGFDVVLVEDAMSALTAAEHEASVSLDFPRLGTVVSTAEAVSALG